MRVTDLFALAIKALMDRKVRSALTVLGIMIGGAIIMALVASSSGLSAMRLRVAVASACWISDSVPPGGSRPAAAGSEIC